MSVSRLPVAGYEQFYSGDTGPAVTAARLLRLDSACGLPRGGQDHSSGRR